MVIGDIDWGNHRAERDRLLTQCFVELPDIEHLVSGTKTLIVGKKGAGKTALLIYLKEKIVARGEIVAVIHPERQVNSSLGGDERTSQNDRVLASRDAWTQVILAKLLVAIAKTTRGTLATSAAAERIRHLVADTGLDTQDPIERVVDLLRMVVPSKVSLEKLKLEFQKHLVPGARPGEVESLVQDYANSKVLWVFVDDLDWAWDNSRTTQDILTGLCLCKYTLEGFGIRCILSLRTEIYNVLKPYPQLGDKFSDRMSISWDFQQLRRLVINRVGFNARAQGDSQFLQGKSEEAIFRSVFPESIGRESIENFLTSRTQSNPRALLLLATMYTTDIRLGPRNRSSITSLKSISKPFSKERLTSLISEQSLIFPSFPIAVDAFRKGVGSPSTKSNRVELVERLEGALAHMERSLPGSTGGLTPDRCIEMLCVSGLLGHGQSKSSIQFDTLEDYRYSLRFQVHPAFVQAIA